MRQSFVMGIELRFPLILTEICSDVKLTSLTFSWKQDYKQQNYFIKFKLFSTLNLLQVSSLMIEKHFKMSHEKSFFTDILVYTQVLINFLHDLLTLFFVSVPGIVKRL